MDNFNSPDVLYLVTFGEDDLSLISISFDDFRIMRDEMEELGIEYQIFGQYIIVESDETSFKIGG